MDNQYSPPYHMPYPQGQGQGQQQHPHQHQQQNPTQQAPMGAYAALNGTNQSQQQSQQHQATQQPSGSQSSAQQDSSHATLPPLQGQNGYAHFSSLSYGHNGSGTHTPTSHTPTPTTSIANPPANAYSHVSPASAMGPPNAFASHYPMSQSMMYPSSTSTSMPNSTASHGLAALRPNLQPSLAPLPSLSNSAHMGQQPAFLQNEEAPTHVVGSQGRRGILPSIPGRPNAGSTSIKNMMPQKDADGKFPCPHCNKTYLHAKHLKRHMLRHTGDRPYSCHLCKDTFSRSDILKRHFQKCSIRRGNPTGANHLAHQRRGNNSNASNRLSMSQQEGPIGLANLAQVTGENPYGTAGLSDHSPTVNGDVSTRSSRANSLISPANMSHRGSLAGLGILGNNQAGPDQMSAQPSAFAPNMHGYGLPAVSNATQMPSAYAFNQSQMNGAYFNNPPAQQPMSYLGHSTSRFDHSHTSSPHQQSPSGDASHSHLDSGRMFNPNGQDGFMNTNMSASTNSQGAENIKSEHETKHFPNDMANDLSSNGNMGMVWS